MFAEPLTYFPTGQSHIGQLTNLNIYGKPF